MSGDAELLGDQSVSRETFERLQAFEDLVRKWNPKINLVSRSSLDGFWERHILDSAQMFKLGSSANSWVDLGSGGGLPGIVIAILAAEHAPDMTLTMVESDQRKCAFLRTALRELGVKGVVVSNRIEEIEPLGADVLSARALADLSQLIEYASMHLSPNGFSLFMKGATWQKELIKAREMWSFDHEAIISSTDSNSVILKIEGANRA